MNEISITAAMGLFGLVALLTMHALLTRDTMVVCQLTQSYDTCYTALNR